MTCIVGLEHQGAVYVGADSSEVDIESMAAATRSDTKVFLAGEGRFVIGFSGSWRVGQLLRYALKIPQQPADKDDMAFMVTNFVDAVRTVQKKKGTMKKENEVEESDSDFVVGYRGKVYVVRADLAVARTVHDFGAVGSGEQVALGAMHATRNRRIFPETRIKMALAAASEFCAGVRPPFHIVKLEPEE